MGPVTADAYNHLSAFTCDLAGNTQNDGVYTYTWDAESQLKSAAGVNYFYDGDGRRVYKSSGKLYWYGSGDEILAETDGSGNVTTEYIFFGGKRVAMLPAGGNPQYYVADFLGSSRVVTTNTGVVCHDADFSPYGSEMAYTDGCPAQNNYKFESKERDTETGNDNFGARYYTWRFGRWLSSDWSSVPVPVPYANLTNPQTLNLYAMVSDDPETFADLDGHDVTFQDVDLAIRTATIINESPTFAQEFTAAFNDHSIDVQVVEKGLMNANVPAESRVSETDSEGVTHVTIYLDPHWNNDDQFEHEWGHERDARERGGTQFVKEIQDAKKNFPNHDDRPYEKRADKFKDKVNKERQQSRKDAAKHAKEQKQKDPGENQQQNQQQNQPRTPPPPPVCGTAQSCSSSESLIQADPPGLALLLGGRMDPVPMPNGNGLAD